MHPGWLCLTCIFPVSYAIYLSISVYIYIYMHKSIYIYIYTCTSQTSSGRSGHKYASGLQRCSGLVRAPRSEGDSRPSTLEAPNKKKPRDGRSYRAPNHRPGSCHGSCWKRVWGFERALCRCNLASDLKAIRAMPTGATDPLREQPQSEV